MSFLVIIPTYNEAENIGDIITQVFDTVPNIHVLVIDDNSKDGTRAIIEKKQTQFENRLFLEKRSSKMGLGSAYIHGFRWALKREYDFISEMDADFSHPVAVLADFERLLSSKECDVVIGSRYVKGGSVKNWPASRKFISKMGSLYARVLTGLPVYDTTSGFVAYRKEVLREINLNVLSAEGYVFQIEAKLAAWCLGFRIKEIPICFSDRLYGTSKMNSSIIKEAMLRVIYIAYLLRTGKYTRKVKVC